MSTPTPPSPAPPPLTLTYDNYTPARDPNNRHLFPAYWLGIFLAAILQGIVTTIINLYRDSDTIFGVWIDGFIKSLGFGIFSILPVTIFLGLTIWLRAKLLKHHRFARFRTACFTGFVAGAFPPTVATAFTLSQTAEIALLFATLAWLIFFPIASAFWLCYKSNLRD